MPQLTQLGPCSYEQLSSDALKVYYADLIKKGLLAPSPKAAVDRLSLKYGDRPTRIGTNCRGIVEFRKLLKSALDDSYSLAMIITAPHTHWEPGPIVQTFDPAENRYWVGPVRGSEPFFPVSFVFSEIGPVPYEWADASCRLKTSELVVAWGMVRSIADAISKHPILRPPLPLGISLHHRFKAIFDQPTISTIEVPADDGCGLSYITRDQAVYPLFSAEENQVGWSSSTVPELSPDEVAVLEELDAQLSGLPLEDVNGVLKIISKSVR